MHEEEEEEEKEEEGEGEEGEEEGEEGEEEGGEGEEEGRRRRRRRGEEIIITHYRKLNTYCGGIGCSTTTHPHSVVRNQTSYRWPDKFWWQIPPTGTHGYT